MIRILALLLSLMPVLVMAQTAPTVQLVANPTSGISPLSVTLTWSSTNASACTASGGWSGTKAVSGTETLASVMATSTFTLTCTSATGSARLTWTAPTQNTDGTTIAATPPGALAGFKLYHAPTAAGVATATPVVVNDRAATTYTIAGLPVGVRYYAAKAFNTEGIESDFSGTVNNTIVLPSGTASASVTVNVKPRPPTLVTVTQVAYEMNGVKGDGTIMLGRDVGRVALGAACIDYQFVTNKGTFYGIDRENVELYRTPKSSMIITKCEKTG